RTKRGRNTKVPQSGGSPKKVGDEAINEEMFDSVERAITTDVILDASHDSDNITKTQSTTTLNEPHPQGEGSGSGPWRQETMGGAPAQTRSERVLEQPIEPPLSEGHTSGSGEGRMEHQFELTANVPITPHDSPLPGGYTPGSDEGRLKLQELMTMCTKLSKQVLDLEKEKDAQAVEILRLKKRVKRLERQRKSSTSQPRRRKYGHVESSDDDLDEEDASKQGRKNDKTNLMLHESDFDGFDDEIVDAATTGVSTASAPVTTAGVAISTAEPRTPPTMTTVFDDEDVTMEMAQNLIKIKEEKAKEKGVAFKDVEDSSRPVRSITTLQPLPSIDPKYKGKELAEIERIQKEKAAQEEVSMAAIYAKGGYKQKHFKGMIYEDIRPIFKRVWDQNQSFVPMDSELEVQILKREDELSQEQLQQLMIIVPEEGMHVEALQTKFPIIYWKVHFEEPTDDKERALWVELKRLFKPDEDDVLWKLQRYMHDPLTWKLYDTCGVHHVSTKRGHDIFMLVEKDYPLTRALMTLMLCNKLRVDEYSVMADELLRKIFILANRPRYLFMCGGMFKEILSQGEALKIVSFREMTTSQLQGKLWLYDEVRT
ncbi:hypothetical protein Tco_0637816, partial [Tanacetum coccineum]